MTFVLTLALRFEAAFAFWLAFHSRHLWMATFFCAVAAIAWGVAEQMQKEVMPNATGPIRKPVRFDEIAGEHRAESERVLRGAGRYSTSLESLAGKPMPRKGWRKT